MHGGTVRDGRPWPAPPRPAKSSSRLTRLPGACPPRPGPGAGRAARFRCSVASAEGHHNGTDGCGAAHGRGRAGHPRVGTARRSGAQGQPVVPGVTKYASGRGRGGAGPPSATVPSPTGLRGAPRWRPRWPRRSGRATQQVRSAPLAFFLSLFFFYLKKKIVSFFNLKKLFFQSAERHL